jgi:hypothetical protein
VTHTRCCINTFDSPDDEHKVAQNMVRIEINIYKRNCASSWLFVGIKTVTYVRVAQNAGNFDWLWHYQLPKKDCGPWSEVTWKEASGK